MKKFILCLLLTAVIVVVGLGAYFCVKQSKTKTHPTAASIIDTLSPTQALVGNDRDEHGCVGSAGYQWCEVKKKCLRSWEEPCTVGNANDAEEIKQALIKKNNWTNMEIEVTVSKNDGQYASGGVKEKGSEAGGGYFFAVKDGGVWKIVADGNGTISCDSLVPYPDYPSSMIPECYDEQTGQVVKR
jgi:hypothetical protein